MKKAKMNLLDRMAMNWLDRKFSQTRTTSTMVQIGEAISTPQNYEGYSRKGYQKNAMVFTCVNKIATAVSGVEWCLYSKRSGKKVEIEEHPLLDLIQRPNPMQGQTAFFEAWVGYYLLSGNHYVEAFKPFQNKPPTEIWPARPDRMKIIGGRNGYPALYRFEDAGRTKDFPVDFVKMTCDILHVKTFNPTNNWYGQSYLQAGASAMDQNNAGNEWNLATLQNSASPSGIFTISVTNTNPKGELSDAKFQRLKQEIDETYSGAKNAGRPMIGEGGLSWQQMSMSPKDMDFLNNRNVSSEDICRVFGVPAEIVGLGQKTFANYKEANLAFYMQTVIPMLKGIRFALNKWLTPVFGDDLYLDYNEDDIEVIQQYRMDQFAQLQSVSFLTQNEKRAKIKYEEKPGWDVFVIGNQAVATPDELSGGGSFDENPIQVSEETPSPSPSSITPTTDDSDEEDEEGEKGISFQQFKSFNLLNENERQKSRRQQAARKARLERDYYKDLREDFAELNEKYFEIAETIRNPSQLEYALINASAKFMPEMAKTIRKHDRIIMEEFGFVVFNEAKSKFVGQYVEKKANVKYDDYVRSFVNRRSGEAIKSIQSTNQKQIHRIVKRITETALTNGETNVDYAKELLSEFDGLSAGRARTIARTETAVASNNASREAVKSLQLPNMEKGWVSSLVGDRRDGGKSGDEPNHQVMNGQWVPIDEKFLVPPDADMDGPGDETADASQVCNCGCAMVYRSRN